MGHKGKLFFLKSSLFKKWWKNVLSRIQKFTSTWSLKALKNSTLFYLIDAHDGINAQGGRSPNFDKMNWVEKHQNLINAQDGINERTV